MLFASLLTASLATGAVASAIPPRVGTTANFNGARGFSVSQVRNTKFGAKSGPLALAKAYAKFGAPLPQDLVAVVDSILASLERRDTGSATNTPTEYDSEYLTPVSIGTPAQVLNLDFDTGSSDLWVFSSETPSSERSGQSIYTPSSSNTSEKLSGETWEISYGDGSSSSGDVYSDVVAVGELSVTGQAVEAAKTVSTSFTSDSDNDGLLGLGFSSINTVSPTQQTTFFDTAKDSLDKPLFTADLKYEEPGTYNFGFIDDSAYNGTITYTDADSSEGYWGFTSPAYAIGSTKTSKSISGIADTGTTLLLLPDTVVKAYYAKVSGAAYDSSQGGYTFSCTATLPTFSYYITSSAKIEIPSEYLSYAPITDGSSTCYGGLQSSDDIGISIYGDVALKAAFVVFENDGSSPQLGFASKSL